MASRQLSIRKRLGYSFVGLLTVTYGLLLVATDQVIRRDRLQRHERLVMATSEAVAQTIDAVETSQKQSQVGLSDMDYQRILNDFSATRVVVWLSRKDQQPIFPEIPSVKSFFRDPTLLDKAGVNAPGMQKPRSFDYDERTYFTCSMPLPNNQGVLRFLEDVGVNPTVRRENLIVLFLIWIVLVAVSTIIVRRLLTVSLLPLKTLEEVMETLSLRPSGVVSQECAALDSHPPELHGIVASYNRLADRLQESWTQQLLFMRSVSHELITPLTLIGSTARRLGRRFKDLPASDVQLIQSLESEAWKTDRLVRDLIDLARSESGSLSLSLEKISAFDVLQQILGKLDFLPWGKRVQHASLADLAEFKAYLLEVNADRLVQCILNVLENASKYSPESTPIDLSLRLQDNKVLFDIKDQGCGISTEEQEKIFKPFFRGAEGSDYAQGSGVGLALVAQLVALMNGQIYVSESSAAGTVMRFEFPVAH